MDGWWPRSGSYMGQKAWIRRSLSKDGIKTEVDNDEERGGHSCGIQLGVEILHNGGMEGGRSKKEKKSHKSKE